jgi:hypothetical protein
MSRKLLLTAAVLGLAAGLAYSSESEDHSAVLDLTSATYEDTVRPPRTLPRRSGACGRSLTCLPTADQRRQGLLRQVLRAVVR